MLDQPFFLPAILFLILGLPLLLGLVPRQWAIGIRTPKTLSDDEIWLRANRFAGGMLLCAGTIYLAAAWLLPCTAPCGVSFTQWLLHLGAFVLPLFTGLLLIFRYIESL